MSNDDRYSVVTAYKAAAVSCPLPGAVDLIGEKWAILILCGSMTGLRHFEEFQSALGIARNILSDRLAKLVAGGLLERTPDSNDRRKIVYKLTPKGEDLLPVMAALRQWAQRHRPDGASILLVESATGQPVQALRILSEDGRELTLEDVEWVETETAEQDEARTAA